MAQKVKIGKGKPDPEKMRKHKDFGRLLTDYEKAMTPLYKKPLYKDKRAFLALLLIILAAVLVFELTDEGPGPEKIQPKGPDTAKVHVTLPADSVITNNR